jgi:hypothetical protein
MPDDLLVIAQFSEAWEAAQALLWKRVNDQLKKAGTGARLPTDRRPLRLTLDAALNRLRVAVANLIRVLNQHSLEVPPEFPWLTISGQLDDPRDFRTSGGSGPLPPRWLSYPIDNPAVGEHQLSQLLSVKDVDADFWQREIIKPVMEHAQMIRSWLKDLKKKAGRPKPTGASRKKIPPDKRTRPMSLKEAARLMGYKAANNKKAAESLRRAMNIGAIPYEELTRKSFVFSRDDFPKRSWPKILPKP